MFSVRMIVLIALLNDAPIMTIAYDNVRYHNEQEKWDMRHVLAMAALLGVIGVIFSFGLFLYAVEVLHLPREIIQPFIFS